MLQAWDKPFTALEQRAWNVKGARLLQIGMGIAISLRIAAEFRFADYFYGVDGAAIGSTSTEFGRHMGLLIDSLFRRPYGPEVFLFVWALAAFGLILGKFHRLASLVALLCFICDGSLANTQDGGDNIARILLFYMLFLHPKLSTPSYISPGTQTFFHNLAVLAIYIQVCILYLVSGTAKLGGETWINGTAIYYITHTEAFAPSWLWVRDLFKNPFIVAASSYATIVYQIGFPFMLLNHLHLVWVILGIAMHLGIAIVMGLVPFSTVMISIILFTVRDSEWSTLQKLKISFLDKFKKVRIANLE